jgi:N-acetylneuraminic acid mutarotase
MKKLTTLLMMLLASQLNLIAQNIWTAKASLITSELQGATSFSIGTKGYIVTGTDGSGNGSVKLWEYEQATDTWTSKSNFPGATRTGAVAFSIGTKGYVGTGESVAGVGGLNDFWEWDQVTDTWTQLTNFAGTARKYAAAFAVDGKGYIGTGWDISMTLKSDFWEYNPLTNSWTAIASIPTTPRYAGAGFSIGTKGYFCSGHDGYGGSPFPNDLYEFNPATNTWTAKASLPSSGGLTAAGRNFAFSFTIGHTGYLGTGTYIDTSISFMPLYCHDFWEYNQITDSWTQRADFPGGNRQWSIGFGIGSKGYAGTGEQIQNSFNDLWEWSASEATDVTENKNVSITISIFQNPAVDYAVIQVPTTGDFSIYNSLGQNITTLHLNSNEVNKLSLAKFTNGIYFIKSNNNNSEFAKFCISH